MPEKRVNVWVQKFPDRPNLMLQWIDPDTGKRKSQSTGTPDPRKAEQMRVDLEADLNNGRYQEASRMSWERFRELFEDEYVATRRPNTRRNFAVVLDHFEHLCPVTKVSAISERTVSAFAAGLRKLPGKFGPGMMPSSVKVMLQFLRTALRWAAGQKLIPAAPRFPEIKVPRKKPQGVAAESFERILAKATDPRMQAFLLCGWLAGLRLREAFTLEREPTIHAPYVDLLRNRIILPAEVVKAVEDQWLTLDPTLREALLALPTRGRRYFRFVNQSGQEIGAGAVSQRIVQLARAAGVKLTMRALRRGFGCFHASRVPAQVLQKLMRHADIKTTMAYYANVDDAAEKAILSRCNSLRNSGPRAAGDPEGGSDTSPCQEEVKGTPELPR
jgi:integrase